jgi:hypothetical protein
MLIFALVAHDGLRERAFKAVLMPGALVIVLLAAYSAYIGVKEKVVREPPNLREMSWRCGCSSGSSLVPGDHRRPGHGAHLHRRERRRWWPSTRW